MMIDIDELPPGDAECDICVVGCGAAGIALANALDGSNLRVMICESGGLDHEPPTQALYESEISGKPLPGANEGRFRVYGGSTTRWGGQALPLLASDFAKRDWVPHSGWPVSYEEVARFYPQAARMLLVDELDFDDQLYSLLRRERGAFDPQLIWHHFSKWSPEPDLRRRSATLFRASRNVTLVLHANLIELHLKPSLQQVELATFQSLAGKRVVVRARRFVLCTGGIETARILLANRSQCPNGIGNNRGLVGRFFQDHPGVTIGVVKPAHERRFQRMFNVSQRRGVRYSSRLTARPQLQQAERMLNASAYIYFTPPQNSGMVRLKNAHSLFRSRRPLSALRELFAAALRPQESVYPFYRFAVFGEIYTPVHEYVLGITGEQEPSPLSWIGLSQRVDAFGIPRANVHWQLSDLLLHTFRTYARVLQAEFQRTGIAAVKLYPWLEDDSFDWRSNVFDQAHHLGTTRMSDTPEHGVVDANLKVHGIDNLYIASSSVFPTGGHSNPTFTILALTFRLAEHLRAQSSDI